MGMVLVGSVMNEANGQKIVFLLDLIQKHVLVQNVQYLVNVDQQAIFVEKELFTVMNIQFGLQLV